MGMVAEESGDSRLQAKSEVGFEGGETGCSVGAGRFGAGCRERYCSTGRWAPGAAGGETPTIHIRLPGVYPASLGTVLSMISVGGRGMRVSGSSVHFSNLLSGGF